MVLMVQTWHAAENEAGPTSQPGLGDVWSVTFNEGLPRSGLCAFPCQRCIPEGMSRALYLNKNPRKTPGHRRAPLLYT